MSRENGVGMSGGGGGYVQGEWGGYVRGGVCIPSPMVYPHRY